MLKLRKEHLDAFEAQIVRLFATRVVAHVKAVWPEECQELGDAAVAEMVRGGIQRAAALGLVMEYDVVRFVDLQFILAKDFDTNPLAGWTRTVLNDRTLAPPAKIERLYQRMEEEFTNIEKRMRPKSMTTSDKIGLYGKGTSDVARARADTKKALEHLAKNFSKVKTYNCTVQPHPRKT